MKFSNTDNQPSRLNLTSLIDVVFLLLIFFMVSTTFEKQAKLKIELPEASQESNRVETQSLTITINDKGTFYVNNSELINVKSKALKRSIIKVAGENRSQNVIIRADANTAHKNVVLALDVLGQLGFEAISIATTETTEP